ncbi:hypothetical protein ACFWVP_11095 [Streptomyces sp. NPDC058637]|uniref:hypothetical protein n=1 Tax=Streptomyces sp. NPDC058637 TaxID=3346569 RepID=UPI00365AB9EC
MPSPWHVLNAAARVGDGFQWTDQTRTDTPTEILRAEGVSGAVADADMRSTRTLSGNYSASEQWPSGQHREYPTVV